MKKFLIVVVILLVILITFKDIMKLIDYKLLLVQLQYDLQAMEEKRHVAGKNCIFLCCFAI